MDSWSSQKSFSSWRPMWAMPRKIANPTPNCNPYLYSNPNSDSKPSSRTHSGHWFLELGLRNDTWYRWYMIQMIRDTGDTWCRWYVIQVIHDAGDTWYRWYTMQVILDTDDTWYRWYMIQMIHDTDDTSHTFSFYTDYTDYTDCTDYLLPIHDTGDTWHTFSLYQPSPWCAPFISLSSSTMCALVVKNCSPVVNFHKCTHPVLCTSPGFHLSRFIPYAAPTPTSTPIPIPTLNPTSKPQNSKYGQ